MSPPSLTLLEGSVLKLLQDFVELPCQIQLCTQDLYQSLQYDATH